MTDRRRRAVLGLGTLAGVALLLNAVGVLRYPGGPLRDPSDDGPLLLDMRPAGQGAVAVGNTLPSEWAIAGRVYDFGLTVHNPTGGDATIDAVTPIDSTPGLTLEAVYVRVTGSPSNGVVGFAPTGIDPDPATRERDFRPLPVAIRPNGDTHENDTQILVVVRSDRPGAFGFSALALDYRIGPLTFRAIQHLALTGCLGPLPPGGTCPPDE